MIHQLLQDKKVVLASASPRRQTLLSMLGLTPLVVPAHIHEPITADPPYKQAMTHARNKALAVAGLMDENSLVIGADTIVVLNGRILGKPADADEAKDYLRLLSGQTHRVYTGGCLLWKARRVCAYERSQVQFAPLSEAEIAAYVATREPLDKAGAYGIQGYGGQFVKQIRGCYYNVMGFPISLFYSMLQDMFKSDALTV